MLGPIGPIVGNFLRSRGYVLRRKTEIENTFTRSAWKDWFSTDLKQFVSVYEQNRNTLAGVKNWISEETLAGSISRYGDWKNDYTPIESEITVADLLSFIARRSGAKVSYLEIGVSVGKNLLQIDRQLRGARLVGLDIEELNPILKNQFSDCVIVTEASAPYLVKTRSKGLLEKRTSLKRLTSAERGNVFEYLNGDQFLDSTWALLEGKKFNLILSDAFHSGEALRAEFGYLLKYELIDQNCCVMLWDDLENDDLQTAFLDNARALCRIFKRDDSAISLYWLHGSYGPRRQIGMFSSISSTDR